MLDQLIQLALHGDTTIRILAATEHAPYFTAVVTLREISSTEDGSSAEAALTNALSRLMRAIAA